MLDFENLLAQHQVFLTDWQKQQFFRYAKLLIEYNQKINLTAIVNEAEIYEKHFYDSFLPALIYPMQGSLCDVGAGAGFPSLPLKIIYPDLKITIIEPLKKRIKFLEVLKSELKLDVNLVNERAEVYSKTNREKFDIVTARAVAQLPILIELCGALVKKEGVFLALKGQAAHFEVEKAIYAAETMGLKLEKIHQQALNQEINRYNIIYRKIKATPKKYPRQFALIKKKSL